MAAEVSRKPNPTHPTYAYMIGEAIKSLGESSTPEAISQFIVSNFDGLPPGHDNLFPYYLRMLTNYGEFVAGPNGRYFIASNVARGQVHTRDSLPKTRPKVKRSHEEVVIGWKGPTNLQLSQLSGSKPTCCDEEDDPDDTRTLSNVFGLKPKIKTHIRCKEPMNSDKPTEMSIIGDGLMLAQSEVVSHEDVLLELSLPSKSNGVEDEGDGPSIPKGRRTPRKRKRVGADRSEFGLELQHWIQDNEKDKNKAHKKIGNNNQPAKVEKKVHDQPKKVRKASNNNQHRLRPEIQPNRFCNSKAQETVSIPKPKRRGRPPKRTQL